jgi:hypothetical protein
MQQATRAGMLGILASATSRRGDKLIQLALFEKEKLQKLQLKCFKW